MFKFKTQFAEDIFKAKYQNKKNGCSTWPDLAYTLVGNVCSGLLEPYELTELVDIITDMKFIPAGRYLYYAGRLVKYYNNCFAMIAEDTREGWADLGYKHFMGLMCGGGIGTYYGKIRPNGSSISKTGGVASGSLSLMHAMNEIGRNVQQGGSRRSALYASLPYNHGDIIEFMYIKDWSEILKDLKTRDFNFPAPLDMTNISVVYDSLQSLDSKVFDVNVEQAMKSGEPGFSFNLNAVSEVGRNACSEFITDTDSDLCNLGSLNFARIKDLDELARVTKLASKFLVCGSIKADLPYEKCKFVREQKRKIGLGIMGMHEWMLQRGLPYGMSDELTDWMGIYTLFSEIGADDVTSKHNISQCTRYRCIAPAGTISIIASTTSGIEPLYSVATKRRYLKGDKWQYQYIIDPLAQQLINDGVDPDSIETSNDLSKDIERRIAFQADVQDYVDMGISSTLNLPAWGSEYNKESLIPNFSKCIKKYVPRLRGITCYPDGSRGGQPLTHVSYEEAKGQEGLEFSEQLEFLSKTSCPSGACGI